MKWEFGDGTVVHLGGKVQGDSALAQAVRLDVSRVKAGIGVLVEVDICPSERRRLELDDAQLVNEWLRHQSRFRGVPITSAPELEPIEHVQWPQDDSSPTRIH